MDDKRWRNEKSVEKMHIKLTEEVGEVAKCIDEGYFSKKEKRAMDEELSHVIFIATMMRHRLARSTHADLPKLKEFSKL
jgi:NTP pyrophosphatase (non-canonical NTP hydrolase)